MGFKKSIQLFNKVMTQKLTEIWGHSGGLGVKAPAVSRNVYNPRPALCCMSFPIPLPSFPVFSIRSTTKPKIALIIPKGCIVITGLSLPKCNTEMAVLLWADV